MPQYDEERIAREEAYWTPARLFTFGFVFMAGAIALIVLLSELRGLLG
ncbi:MAG: hypothetical protein MJD61_18915 [Proteobacteria bacterium]|nr:hypothetical protein [Pseudomonadota bacterium]